MAVDGVTMTGLKSFLRGLRNYANIFLLPNISAINSNVLFKKYFEEQEYFRKKFDIPLRAIEKKENDGFKSSVTKFFFILEYMIKKNEENFLFIKEGQLSDFFSKSAPFFFKLKSNIKFLNPEIYASETLKVFDQLNWKTIFTADHNVEESETIKLILKSKLLPRWTGRYRMYIRVYSTLINKIFCEGTVDLKANFLKRQKEAIHFFDSIWSLFTTKKFGLMVIKDEDLPIKDYLKPDFLNSFVCKTTNNHFQIKINNSNKNRNETFRYDLHNKLNHKNKRSYSNFKSFLQSFFICILKCYE
ncbi:hypothetical protein BY996DRAFT_8197088 [Phakopsora pachyrhizi]|nr:hypothetical protein BY996DRAFT_8197088 [Phakopsora pachyrhizi]